MPRPRALLLVLLVALLTALAGPSAAASAATSDAADTCATSVTGIAPNGDEATLRAGHPVPQLPVAVLVSLGGLLGPASAAAAWRVPLLPHSGTANPVPHNRGPPTG